MCASCRASPRACDRCSSRLEAAAARRRAPARRLRLERRRRGRRAQAEGAVRLQEIGSFDEPVYVTAPPGDKQPRVRRRAGRDDPRRQGRQDARHAVPRHHATASRPAASRACCRWRSRPTTRTSGLFYVYYTDTDGDQRVVEYKRRSDDVGRPGLRAPGAAACADREPNHNGGLLLFGPDRLLYIGTGDGGGGGDQHGARGNGQSLGTLLGQDPAHRPARRAAAGPYSVPRDEPVRGPRRAHAARSTATACATRGASRSTARPAT